MNSSPNLRRWLGLRKPAPNSTHLSVLRAWPFWLILAFLAIVYGATAWHVASEQRLLRDGDTPAIQLATGADLRVPENRVGRGKPLLFEYGSNKDTRFVVRRGRAKEIQAALAACRECYRKTPRPNYVLKGQVMCGMCRQAMRMPAGASPGAKQECELLQVPYSRQNGDVVIPFETVMTAFNELSGAGPRQSR